MKAAAPALGLTSSRDLTIDFVRGLCFPIMMIDHLRNHWLTFFTFRPLGFFCAATIFVFLSGFVAGTVYSRSLSSPRPTAIFFKCFRRAGLIWLIHILISAAAILITHVASDLVAPLGLEIEFAVAEPWEALESAILLMPCAPMLDILPMYVFFLLATPVILRQFHFGRARTVFAISAAIWTLSQIGIAIPLPPFAGIFDTSAWQFLFVSALYLGFRRTVQPIETPEESKSLNLALFGCIIALFMLRHAEVFSLEMFASAIPAWWVNKTKLGPFLVLNLYLWVTFLWLVPTPLRRLAHQGRVFIALGQHSLPVFVWHILLFYLFMSLFPQLQTFSLWGQAVIVSFAVICLIFPVSFSAHRFRNLQR